MLKFILFLSCLCVFEGALYAQNTEVRAAFDFGSGAVKVQASVVDIENNALVGLPILAKQISLPLMEDVTLHEGVISSGMQKKCLDALLQLRNEVIEAASTQGHSTIRFAGVATAVFRKAENGVDLLKKFKQKIKISFQILTQEEEAKLGYSSAQALFPLIAEEQLIAWDNGNGSFQMTGKDNGEFKFYQGSTGYGTVRQILATEVRKGPLLKPKESGNPLNYSEGIELRAGIHKRLPQIPAWLPQKIEGRQVQVVTFGDGESLFPVLADSLAKFYMVSGNITEVTLDKSSLEKLVQQSFDRDDSYFDRFKMHRKTSTAALYVLCLMDHLGIEKILYKRAVGNTAGILTTRQFWKK